MSRLDDAIAALRKAAGDRQFVFIIDPCAPAAPSSALRVEWPKGTADYTAIGLMEKAKAYLLSDYDTSDGDVPEYPDPEHDDPE